MAPKPEAEQKAAKKAAKKEPAAKKTTAGAGKKPVGEKGEKKKAKKAISETYKIYIYKVLKQVWRELVEICYVSACLPHSSRLFFADELNVYRKLIRAGITSLRSVSHLFLHLSFSIRNRFTLTPVSPPRPCPS